MPSENNVNSLHTYQQLLKLLCFPHPWQCSVPSIFISTNPKWKWVSCWYFYLQVLWVLILMDISPVYLMKKTLLKKSLSNWKMKKISCRWKISITVLTEQDTCRLWKLPFSRLLIYKKKGIFHCRDRAVTTFPSDLN